MCVKLLPKLASGTEKTQTTSKLRMIPTLSRFEDNVMNRQRVSSRIIQSDCRSHHNECGIPACT